MKRGPFVISLCLAGLGWAQAPHPSAARTVAVESVPCVSGEREREPARAVARERAMIVPAPSQDPGRGEEMPCERLAPRPEAGALARSKPALQAQSGSTPAPTDRPSPFSPTGRPDSEPFSPRLSPPPTAPAAVPGSLPGFPTAPSSSGATGPRPSTATPAPSTTPPVIPGSPSIEASRTRRLPAPPPLPDGARATQRLTYEEAPLLALATNPRIPANLASVRQAIATSQVTASPARPRGELSLQGPPIPQSQDGTSSFRNDYVLSPVRLEVRQLIYDGGRILAAIQRDKALARQYGNLAQEDWNLLSLQVRRAYLSVLTQRGSVALAQEQVGLAREQLQQAEVRVRVGSAPRGDVLSAALPVAQAELGVTRNQGNFNRAVQELNSMLGLSPDTILELEEPPVPQQPLPDLDTCMQQAMAQRPSIEGMRNQLRSAMKGLEAAQLDNHPNINILLGLAAVSQDEKIIGGLTYRGGFEVVWPFWDGTKTKYLSELSRAKVDNAAALVQQEMKKVQLEVSDAYRSLQLAVDAHQTQQQRVLKAQDALRIAQFQYKAGMITPYPVRQAHADLYEARQAEVQAYFDYFVALAQLDFACGRVPRPLEIPQPEPD